jgi:hypothetical protein
MITDKDKALIRRGLQCPKCCSVNTEPTVPEMVRKPAIAFRCNDCGKSWFASEFK